LADYTRTRTEHRRRVRAARHGVGSADDRGRRGRGQQPQGLRPAGRGLARQHRRRVEEGPPRAVLRHGDRRPQPDGTARRTPVPRRVLQRRADHLPRRYPAAARGRSRGRSHRGQRKHRRQRPGRRRGGGARLPGGADLLTSRPREPGGTDSPAVSTTPTALRPRGIAAPPHRGPAAPRYRRPVRQSTSPVHPTPGLFNERNIMRALVYQGPYEVAVQDVEDPAIQDPSDVIVRITTSAICGSDLHMYEGRTDAEPGITFGHENMGVIEEVGPGVTSLSKGDRVVLPFNVACGFCTNCRRGKSAFCLTVNEPGTAGGAYGYV